MLTNAAGLTTIKSGSGKSGFGKSSFGSRRGDMETAGQYQFAPQERPLIPGGPFTPSHPLARRLGYGAIGIVTGIATTFPNALINVNVPNLSGPLGVYVAQAAWLPAIYVAMNATANLTLVKSRIQFGIFP